MKENQFKKYEGDLLVELGEINKLISDNQNVDYISSNVTTDCCAFLTIYCC